MKGKEKKGKKGNGLRKGDKGTMRTESKLGQREREKDTKVTYVRREEGWTRGKRRKNEKGVNGKE